MEQDNPDGASALISPATVVFWFRRDLRLQDNAGLYHALRTGGPVVPVFIFDRRILDELDEKADRRVEFIHLSLAAMQKQLTACGSSLLVLHGNPAEIFAGLRPRAVYANHDYEPYARERDSKISQILAGKGIEFSTFKDQVLFEKSEIVKEDGKPYTVFTPYARKWKGSLLAQSLASYPTEPYFRNFARSRPLPLPTLADIGFEPTGAVFPERVIRQSVIEQYDRQRDFPALCGTTRLSVHLRFGTVSIRHLVAIALTKNGVWLNELVWRDFYHMILWHFPHVTTHSFKREYDRIAWRNEVDEFRKWCEGKTGYPIVDAGMRELNATGFMHNRARMITASFLTKHLLIDWRWGEAYFARNLLDFDLAANNGGWQWAAGSGCDAAPYFRVFNPDLQTRKFDPQFQYIRKWVPEWGTAAYPPPMVEHKVARERALRAYKSALT